MINNKQIQLVPDFMVHLVAIAAGFDQPDDIAIENIINTLLEECAIPLNIITNPENETLKELIETNPYKDKVKVVGVVVVIKYLKTFEA